MNWMDKRDNGVIKLKRERHLAFLNIFTEGKFDIGVRGGHSLCELEIESKLVREYSISSTSDQTDYQLPYGFRFSSTLNTASDEAVSLRL